MWCEESNRTDLMMVSDSCRPSRLRYSSSLQRQMMLSRAEVGIMELDISSSAICRELNKGKYYVRNSILYHFRLLVIVLDKRRVGKHFSFG